MVQETEDKEREFQLEWTACVKAQRYRNKTFNEVKKVLYGWVQGAWEESLRGTQREGKSQILWKDHPLIVVICSNHLLLHNTSPQNAVA